MKLIIPILLFLITFSSCQTYQYFTVRGDNIKQDSNYHFVAENDTLLMLYNFNGYNGPVKVSIYNKMDKPLYVNWKKSAIILEGQAISYYSPDQPLDGTISGTESKSGNGVSAQSGSIQAIIRGQAGMDFIPPHSRKDKTALNLITGFIKEIPIDQMKRTFLDGDEQLPKVKSVDFSKELSPVNFRSYLTFSITGNSTDEFSLEHFFYVSHLFVSTLNPVNIPSKQNNGDCFYTSRSSGFTKGMGVLAGVGLFTGLVMAAGSGEGK